MARVVVLVGMMGTGKTTVGRRLAARLGFRFLDTDDVVVAKSGKPVRRVFEDDGEAVFRRLESQALREALAADSDVVVAAAGGCVISPENRAAIRESSSCTMWLDADVETLGERTSRDAHRPLLDGDARERLASLDRDRRRLYEEVADVRIDTAGRSLAEVVAEAEAAIAKEGAT